MTDSSTHSKISLKPIPEPKPNSRTVLIAKISPLIKGVGDIDLVCAKCGEILVEGISHEQIKNIVIRCPKCNTYNDVVWKLSFAEVRQKIGEHLKTAISLDKFNITYAKLEEDIWKVNVEFIEKEGSFITHTALFSLDATTGEVIEFKKDFTWSF